MCCMCSSVDFFRAAETAVDSNPGVNFCRHSTRKGACLSTPVDAYPLLLLTSTTYYLLSLDACLLRLTNRFWMLSTSLLRNWTSECRPVELAMALMPRTGGGDWFFTVASRWDVVSKKNGLRVSACLRCSLAQREKNEVHILQDPLYLLLCKGLAATGRPACVTAFVHGEHGWPAGSGASDLPHGAASAAGWDCIVTT